VEDLLNLDKLYDILETSVSIKINKILDARKKSTASQKDFTNSIFALDIVKAALEHIKFTCYSLFRRKISKVGRVNCQNLKFQFETICALYGLNYLAMDHHDLYNIGYFSKGTNMTENIQEAIKILLLRLRPQAISLVESFPIADEIVCSAVGNSYGDIYEKHLECAMNSRLNKTKQGDAIPDGYLELMTPILKAKL